MKAQKLTYYVDRFNDGWSPETVQVMTTIAWLITIFLWSLALKFAVSSAHDFDTSNIAKGIKSGIYCVVCAFLPLLAYNIIN